MVDLEKVPSGREQPNILELYNFIIEKTEHYSNLCNEVEEVQRYTLSDEALVLL